MFVYSFDCVSDMSIQRFVVENDIAFLLDVFNNSVIYIFLITLQLSLEAGLPLGKTHHVIDVANVIKYFFRELPEPLIGSSIQETLLRSLLVGEQRIRALLLSCLLLPALTLNTLCFFMQFLNTIALNAHLNKMNAENLAIVFTPGLMPCTDIASHRFKNHLKTVQLLIENANELGTVPLELTDRLQTTTTPVVPNTPSNSRSFEGALEATQKKKKKRRSGSLTRNSYEHVQFVFN